MLDGNDATFAPAAIWLLVLAVAWLTVRRWAGPWARAHPILTITGAAALARAVPAVVLDRGLPFDIEAHWWVGVLTLAGQNVYTAPLAQGRYPYPPLHQYLSAFMVAVSGHDRSLFLVVDKLVPSLFGVALAVVVWAAARRLGHSPRLALLCGLLYALDPLPVLVTSYHGQFEEIPMFFIALALLLLLGERPSRLAVILSALSLGMGVAYKTWPLLFLPPLFLMVRPEVGVNCASDGSRVSSSPSWRFLRRAISRWRWRLLYVPLTLVPLALSLGLYGLAFGRAGLFDAVSRIVHYKGSHGFCWGYVSIVHSCWVHPPSAQPNVWVFRLNNGLLVLAMLAVGALLLWRRRPLEGMVTFPLAFYLFSPGWGPDYSVWVLPFMLIYAVPLAQRYTAVMLPAVSLIYLDSLYAAYNHTDFSWNVLKPLEAAFGLFAWAGVGVLLVRLYRVDPRVREVMFPAAQLVTWGGRAWQRARRAERVVLPD